jgi:ADP-ribose pyrophosphatase YjhB (NUDIX family)
MHDQREVTEKGGTMRLGSYPAKLKPGTRTRAAYGDEPVIYERHRHRFEVNNRYRQRLEEAGHGLLRRVTRRPAGRVHRAPDHPWFVATQAHPELKSRPNRPHPLFDGFVGAALQRRRETSGRLPVEIDVDPGAELDEPTVGELAEAALLDLDGGPSRGAGRRRRGAPAVSVRASSSAWQVTRRREPRRSIRGAAVTSWFETTDVRTVYEGRSTVRIETVRMPEGDLAEREIVVHDDAVAVLPVTDDGEVVLLKQYRQPVRGYVLEVPAGTVDGDDGSPEETAHRELAEEVQLEAGELIHLVTFLNSSGWTTERTHVYLARRIADGPRPDGFDPSTRRRTWRCCACRSRMRSPWRGPARSPTRRRCSRCCWRLRTSDI